MLLPTVIISNLMFALLSRAASRSQRGRGDAGQTTAEYALVLIAAAAVAVLVITWASKTDLIGKLFDFVIGKVTGRAG